MTLEAIIIRADGALFETELVRLQAFERVFSEAGLEPTFDRGQFIKSRSMGGCKARMDHFVRQALRGRANSGDLTALVAAMQRRASKFFIEIVESSALEPRPGVRDLVMAAKRDGVRIAVAAQMNLPEAHCLMERALGTSWLSALDAIVVCEAADRTEDVIKLYKDALAELCLPASGCLVVEATLDGALAAKSAGLPVITTRSIYCAESPGLGGGTVVVEDLPSLIARSDKRRLDPLSADEQTELVTALQRLHAGDLDHVLGSNRSNVMRVSDILKAKGSAVKTIPPAATIRAFADALRKELVGAMVVTDAKGALQGIISERDLARGLADFGGDLSAMSVADLMTKSVVTCAPGDSVAAISKVMTQRRIRHLPVVVDGSLVGLVSIGDVLKHRLDEVQLEASVLRDYAIARK